MFYVIGVASLAFGVFWTLKYNLEKESINEIQREQDNLGKEEAMVLANHRSKADIELKKKIDNCNVPFENKYRRLNLLVFPFKNYSPTTQLNIADGIYQRIVDYKNQNNLHRLNIRYYYDINENDVNSEKVIEIGKRLNAKIVIWGTYQIKDLDKSVIDIKSVHLDNIMINHDENENDIKEESIKFDSIIEALGEKVFTVNIEQDIAKLHKVINEYWFLEFRNFTKLEWFLFKRILNLKRLPPLYSNMEMEQISMHKSLYDPDIPKSIDYGLTPFTPMYGGMYECFYLEYLSLLEYDGKPIKIRGKILKDVEFSKKMLQSSKITGVNSYEIFDMYEKFITKIYVFEKSDHEELKPPTDFTFPYEIISTS